MKDLVPTMVEGYMHPTLFYGRKARTPEESLMVAVLEVALLDYARVRGGIDRYAQREAAWAERESRAWFASTDRVWPYSFLRVCEVLDLDPAGIRRALMRRPVGRVVGAA